MDPFWQCQPSDAKAWWYYRSWLQVGNKWLVLHGEMERADRHAAAMHSSVQHTLWSATITEVFNYNEHWHEWRMCTQIK